jgi:hypothetical protein
MTVRIALTAPGPQAGRTERHMYQAMVTLSPRHNEQ